LFVTSVAGYFLVPGISKEMIVIALIPISYIVSNYLVYMKSSVWDELIFTVLLGLIIAIHLWPIWQ
jgi:hypothetical protein